MGTKQSFFRSHAARCRLAGAALIAVAINTSPAFAQSDAEAKAIVLRPLGFFKVDDLEFGSLLASNAAGTVRIQPSGTRTATGGVTLVGTGHTPARFAGLGAPNQQVLISLSSNAIFITGPGPRMRVRNFEIGSTPTAILSTSPSRFRINTPTGAYNFPLGATLEVGANQPPGDYAGTFTITLNYQ